MALLGWATAGSTCGQFKVGSDGQPCTQIAVPSVVLRITDPDGQVITSAATSFSVDGGAGHLGGCTGSCGRFALAYELTGQYDIQVSALGFQTAQQTVQVPADSVGCHPVTQEVTIALQRDTTAAVLAGAWSTTNFYGQTILRFGEHGEIVGGVFYGQTAGGDHNLYVSYNGHAIRGASGQPIDHEAATEPSRTGDVFNFTHVTAGIPTGFENATMSDDFLTLTGTLSGQSVTYTRLIEPPDPLKDP